MIKANAKLRLLFGIAVLGLMSMSSHAQTPVEYKITGKVFDESNQGVERVRVCAIPPPDEYIKLPQVQCALSDSQGNFLIRTGRPSHFRIIAEKSAAGYQSPQYEFYRNPALPPPAEVTLNATITTADVSVPLGPKNGALIGKVVDANTGFAVENARFSMCHVSNPRICSGPISKNSDGVFKVAAPHVPFTLRIIAEGYEEWWGPNGLGKNNAMTVPSGTQVELSSALHRKPEFTNRPMTEAEKQPLVNLPEPVLLSPADRVEFRIYPRHTKLEWQPVEGAAYYLVEIDVCDGRDRELRECVNPGPFSTNKNLGPVKVEGTTYEFDFVGAQPGRWRIWAVDSKGQEGFKSSWRLFFYLK
jgi:hypothetical protein